jgi:hypothetical protein
MYPLSRVVIFLIKLICGYHPPINFPFLSRLESICIDLGLHFESISFHGLARFNLCNFPIPIDSTYVDVLRLVLYLVDFYLKISLVQTFPPFVHIF